ncbi:hypothetical protein AAG906_016027 [Vitis piasezkii]
MQATWSDTNSEESVFIAFEDVRYDPNDLLSFIASMEFVHDSDCDSDDNEFTDEQRVEFLNNLVEHETLIKTLEGGCLTIWESWQHPGQTWTAMLVVRDAMLAEWRNSGAGSGLLRKGEVGGNRGGKEVEDHGELSLETMGKQLEGN